MLTNHLMKEVNDHVDDRQPPGYRVNQGDHFPDHMKFPDFSLTFPVEASNDYPVSSVYRYGQHSLFYINEKQGEAR